MITGVMINTMRTEWHITWDEEVTRITGKFFEPRQRYEWRDVEIEIEQ